MGGFFMKRTLSLLLCFALSAALFAGCGKQGDSASGSGQQPEATPQPIEVYDYNPLTGLAKDPNVPDGQRPVAVMIDNLREALPQSGLSSADVVLEAVTEGGITRILAVFTDYKTLPTVGPVRSARDQHAQFVLPINALFAHIGGSSYANNLLNYYKYQDIDGYYLGTNAFAFDEARRASKSSEHCWYTNAALIQQGIDKIGTLPVTGTLKPLFDFAAADSVVLSNSASTFSLNFSNYADSAFTYDSASGTYLQSQFGIPHTDANNGSQLSFKNIIVLSSNVSLKKDGFQLEFDLSGGDGWYVTGGKWSPIKWSKGEPDAPLVLKTADGGKLSVNPGKTYIALLGSDMRGTVMADGAAIAG